MIKSARGQIAAVCSLLVLASSAKADPAASESLLPNGSFATDSKGAGWPDGWPRPEGSAWEKEGDIHFLRLQALRPGQTILLYRQVILPTPLPPALEIRLRVRYADIKRGEKAWFDGRVMGHFKDRSGKVVHPDPTAPSFTGSSKGWVDRNYVVKVPPSAHLLELMPCLFQAASGTLDLARCEVFPASADRLPKPPPIIASEVIVPANRAALPPELHVAGNQLQTKAGTPVWLQGLCVDSMEWSAAGEHIAQSIPVAIEQWHASVIRLPVREHFWFGRGPWQKKGEGGLAYRKLVDAAVDATAGRGAYLVLDLHVFGAPMPEHVAFWKDAATRYKNHPAVVFELFNEPHDISWKVWRDGGPPKGADNLSGDVSTGMQALVDAVRGAGARNVVIAGGLDWSYDLSGVVQGYALRDHDGGNGIMYSSHIYPWKKDWKGKVLAAAERYPLFIGEVGTPPDWSGFQFIPESQRFEDLSAGAWPPDVIGLIQQHTLNWTGFSFHPKCGPMVILDWDYTPTPYWGRYVKDALGGKTFAVKRMR